MAESLPGGAPPNNVPLDPNVGPTTPYTPPAAQASVNVADQLRAAATQTPGAGFWKAVGEKVAPLLPRGRSIQAPDPAQRSQSYGAAIPATQLQYTGATSGFAPPPTSAPSVAPVQGPRTIGAHDIDTAGPKVRGAWENAENTQRHADEAAGDRNQAIAREGQDVYQAQADQAAAREAQVKAQGAAQSAALDAQKADFDKSSSEAAKVQIDNDRLWSSKSTAQKAAFHLANIFSGLGRGATGGVNTHLQRWQEAQKADVDAQKHHYDALRGRVGDKQTAYSMGMQKFQNENAAREFANAAHAEGAKAAIGKLAERYKGTDAANEADQKIAMLDALKATHEQQFTKHIQAQTVAAPGALDAKQAFELRKLAIEHGYKVDEAKAAGADKRSDRDASEQAALSKDKEDAGIPGTDAAMSAIDRLKQENGGVIPGTSWIDRQLHKGEDLPVVGGIAGALRGTAAHQVDGALGQLAEGQAAASHQRGTEAIKYNKDIIAQRGTSEDLEAGLARARDVRDRRLAEIEAAHRQSIIDLHARRKAGGAGNE